MILDPKAECASRADLRERQQAGLTKMLGRISRTDFYASRFRELGIYPSAVRLEDLRHLPFTTKDDLRSCYPFSLLSCGLEEIVEVHASSGTTGKPAVGGYTRNDLKTWSQAMARALSAAGLDRKDIIQNAYGYGLFTGGLGFHYGAIELGATVIPVSAGRTEFQIVAAEDFGSTALCCTPSFAIYLAREAERMGRSLKNTKLRVGLFGAEPWSEDMRRQIESASGMKAYDCYGLSEIIGPGVAFECEEQNGLHFNEDFFIPEVINPETGQPVEEGETGELVVTAVAREGLALLRYRTRDVTSISSGTCSCGRTLRKIKRLIGRTDDLLIVAGVNFYPSQVESLILGINGATDNFQIWLWTENDRDYIEVRVETEAELHVNLERREALAAELAHHLRDNIGIRMAVNILPPASLERSVGKAKRVYDNRGKNG